MCVCACARERERERERYTEISAYATYACSALMVSLKIKRIPYTD